MDNILDQWEQKSMDHQKLYKQFLAKANLKKVLKLLPDLHEAAFERIDCMKCANCCRHYSPRFKPPDIRRIAKYLKISETELISKYLHRDEEGDYVVNILPCPFLGEDNACGIYDVRPSDCERFPYTDEDVLLKRPAITQKNSTFCPIVYYVLEHLIAP